VSQRSARTDPAPASDRVYYFVQAVVRMLARLLWRHTLTGQDNLPRGTAYIIATNHLSLFDAPVVFMNSPDRLVMFGADKWRRTPGLRQLTEAMGVIWVTRGEADMDAMRAALGVLKRGARLGLAPEGTRSRTGGLQPGKPGAAYLADRARVPVVPMAISGTERVLACWRRLRRPSINCVIGPPLGLLGDGRAKGARLEELTDQIMCSLAALLPPEYRGVYAGHPLLHEMLAAKARQQP
jgi:1-acyl-sn-glycerol-3-phosphate acyltransferase